MDVVSLDNSIYLKSSGLLDRCLEGLSKGGYYNSKFKNQLGCIKTIMHDLLEMIPHMQFY